MYSWLRDGLIPGASALLESLWLYAWISFFLAVGEKTSAYRYPLGWIVALVIVPTLVGRWLDRSYWGPRWLRQHGMTAIVIGLFVAFMVPYHAAGAAWLAAAALLARGVWLALGEISSDSAACWFLAGFASFLALLGLGVIAHPATWEPDRGQLGPLLAIFLFAGLSWLALVRRQEMEESAFRKPGNELSATWLLLLAALSGGMMAVVALISFGGGSVLRALLELTGVVAGLVWRAAIFVVVNWLGPALLWILSHLPFGGDEGSGGLFRRRALIDLDPRLLAWLRVHLPIEVVLALVGSILIVLVAVWLACRFIARDPGADEEERSSLWSWRLLVEQLRRLLRSLRHTFRPGSAAPRDAEISTHTETRSTIRHLYAEVLRWCRDAQRPRRPAETPLEFEPALGEALDLPLAQDLTGAYVSARYAETEVAEERVANLQRRWQEHLEPS
jgi:hypothetical protein